MPIGLDCWTLGEVIKHLFFFVSLNLLFCFHAHSITKSYSATISLPNGGTGVETVQVPDIFDIGDRLVGVRCSATVSYNYTITGFNRNFVETKTVDVNVFVAAGFGDERGSIRCTDDPQNEPFSATETDTFSFPPRLETSHSSGGSLSFSGSASTPPVLPDLSDNPFELFLLASISFDFEETDGDPFMDVSLAGTQPNPVSANATVSVTFEIEQGAPPTEDLNLKELQIAQSVFDPDIDLSNIVSPTTADGVVDIVANKKVAVFLAGTAVNVPPLTTQSVDFYIKDILTDNEIYYQSAFFFINTDNSFEVYQDLPEFDEGRYQVRAVVDPNNILEEANESNNMKTSKEFEAHKVNPLSIGVVEIQPGPPIFNGSPPYNLPDAATTSGLLDPSRIDDIEDFFAVEFGTTTVESLPRIQGDMDNSLVPISIGLLNDYIELAKLSLTQNKRKIFASVNQDYFGYHAPNVNLVGLTRIKNENTGTVAFFSDGEFDTFSHELAHLFGANHQFDPPQGQGPPIVVNGYSNRVDQPRLNYRPLMLDKKSLENLWVTNETYERSLVSLLVPAIDPEIVVVSGFFNKQTNEVSNLSLEIFPEGTLSSDLADSPLKVGITNAQGQIESQVGVSQNVSVVFEVIDEDGNYIEYPQVLENIPFVVALPSTDLSENILISYNEEVVADFKIFPVLTAREIIESIELSDVRGRKSRARRAKLKILLKLATKFDQKRDSGKIKLLSIMRRLIIFKVKLFLKPGTTKERVISEFLDLELQL